MLDWGSQQSLPPLEVVMLVLVSLVFEFRFWGVPAASENLPVFVFAKNDKTSPMCSALVMSVARCSWIGYLPAGSDWTSLFLDSYFGAVDI